MNAKTEQQIANLKTQTIGVEIEMNHITRKNAAKLAADFFGTGRYEDTAHRNGYYTWSAWDAEGREWKFQRDVSIAGADSEKCELVTPILHYEDIEILQELVRRLRKAGAISHAGVGAGVHIHIGANGHTPQTLRNQWLSCLQSWNGRRFYLFFWKKVREVTTLSLLFLDFFAGAR